MRRRGFTLLFVTGMLLIISMAVAGLATTAAIHYRHVQVAHDRLQALECAQAGIIWARRAIANGDDVASTMLSLGDDTQVRIACQESDGTWIVESIGETLRHDEVVAQRRLSVTIPQGGGQS